MCSPFANKHGFFFRINVAAVWRVCFETTRPLFVPRGSLSWLYHRWAGGEEASSRPWRVKSRLLHGEAPPASDEHLLADQLVGHVDRQEQAVPSGDRQKGGTPDASSRFATTRGWARGRHGGIVVSGRRPGRTAGPAAPSGRLRAPRAPDFDQNVHERTHPILKFSYLTALVLKRRYSGEMSYTTFK